MAAIPGLSPFVPVCFLCLPRFLVSLTPSAPALSLSILPVCFQSRLLAFAIHRPDLEIQLSKSAGAAGCLGPQLQGWSGPRPVLPWPLDKRVWESFRSMFPFSSLFCFCDEMPEKTLECGGLLQLTVPRVQLTGGEG